MPKYSKQPSVSWYVPKRKRPIAYSATATAQLIGLLAEDGLTFAQARASIYFDSEAQDVLDKYIELGYADYSMADFGVRY